MPPRGGKESQQILKLEFPLYFDKVFFEDELLKFERYIEKRIKGEQNEG